MAYKKQHIDLRVNSCTMKEERYSLTDIDDLCQSPLAKSLGSGHYVWIGEQASLGGKTAYSMFVLNISVWAIAYYCHKFRLPAFIYGELHGGVYTANIGKRWMCPNFCVPRLNVIEKGKSAK